MMIYKIFRAGEWAELQQDGTTLGAPVDLSDGYIHFSTAQHVAETARRHFSGEENLMLLALDSDAMGEELRWEPSRGGALFPHLFRALTLDEVLWARPLPLVGENHVFPEDLA